MIRRRMLLLASVGVLGLGSVSPAWASGSSTVTPTSVAQGATVQYVAAVSTKAKACDLSLTDTQTVPLGRVKVVKKGVAMTINTSSLPPGGYRAVLRCGKDRAIVSPSFTVTGPQAPAPTTTQTNAALFVADMDRIFRLSGNPQVLCQGMSMPYFDTATKQVYDAAGTRGVVSFGLDFSVARSLAFGVAGRFCLGYGYQVRMV